ncbi:hypothetical protein EGH21_04340 [Halomicroarcula sp. F13]|uniref:Uncharacterized protein n=1 Tax=Haloarcula rubra TaxID=2487747 RepID=A0AAW4PNV1_9EURY|nr:hypothetical protein [Halomicroarcula rubra]MBX0322260.1 hypothetical protein [Halomicroarcula rubra]
MCHHRGDIPDWSRDRADELADADEESDEEPEIPSFLNEAETDVEVLTDGGDGEE